MTMHYEIMTHYDNVPWGLIGISVMTAMTRHTLILTTLSTAVLLSRNDKMDESLFLF